MIEREKIFKLLDKEIDKVTIAKSLDAAELAQQKNMVKETDFLDPYYRDTVLKITKGLFGIKHFVSGGYQGAERARIVFFPDFLHKDDVEDCISCIEINGSFPKKYSHRDFLGSILGLGISREKLGDIIVSEDGCQAVIDDSLVDFVKLNLEKVGNVSVKVKEIYPHQLKVEDIKIKKIKGTVASLRLDAVSGLGFGLSRTKLSGLIKGERVKVNWKTIKNPSFTLEEGDIISLRGKGRVELAACGGETRKGRIHLELNRFM
ncbi:YlmH/Sll1252 family protein [Proteinivorax hydrogeniformans]|uniref:YlmH/Sll1252 family protein n=1 Tax=Proteinivorax hydrogeniformans TaxID=1826727 RepID=A0AAU8HQX0_9FIRM